MASAPAHNLAVELSPPPALPAKESVSVAQVAIPLLAIACLTPWVTPPIALTVGMAVALTLGNPYSAFTKKSSKTLLQACVVFLGFGMDLGVVLRAGRDGLVFAAITIVGTCAAGMLLGRLLKMSSKLSALVSCGTAICGGSAIAAVGSVIAAGEGEMTVAMGTVFMLNAVALYVFPPLGHALHLSQTQFGTWAGVAIHDVSSVVGAASQYGATSLQVATAVKLSRALWIIPVTVAAAAFFRQPTPVAVTSNTIGFDPNQTPARHKGKMQVPWFIGLFLLASVIRSYSPAVAHVAPQISTVARQGLTLTLFLIGLGLSRKTLKAVGFKPLIQAVVLFLLISTTALLFIKCFGA